MKKYLLFILFIVTTALGAALLVTANIGISAWDGVAYCVSYLSGVQIGSVGTFFNLACFVIASILLAWKVPLKNILMIFTVVLLGGCVNFFVYDVLGFISHFNFGLKLIVCLLGQVILGFSIGGLMSVDIVSFPLEYLCSVISEKVNKSFVFVRYAVDVLCLISIVLMIVLLKVPNPIGIGTIIGVILFSWLVGFATSWWDKTLA